MASEVRESAIAIQLLGGFRIAAGDGDLPADAWPGRRAAELVQLLAVAHGHRLTRDEVIEALWPHLGAEAGAANLRKAAHHARQTLGAPDAIVLRGGQVALFPARPVETDADRFESHARAALAGGDAAECAAAASAYTGDLLPESLYEEWTLATRERLRSRFLELLRRSDQWERLVEVDPTDEPAYRELMRGELAVGSRPAAIRWYGRLRTLLRRDLGILPSVETQAIYDDCIAGLALSEPAFIGRALELGRTLAALRSEPCCELAVVAVRGPPGIGKSAFCREFARVARNEAWMTITVTATEANGAYGPLAALAEQLEARDATLRGALGSRGQTVLAQLRSSTARTDLPTRQLTRHHVIGAFRRLLESSGSGSPVALIIDDAHLADQATIDVLQHLGSPRGTPVLPVLAYRREPAPEALTRGVARLARGGRALEIDLEPLDRDEAAALVAAATHTARATDVVDRIVDLAQGNPFLTLELARSAVAGIPALVATARDAIVARFLDLDPGTVEMLQRLALAGDDLDPASIVALTDDSEAEVFAQLDDALDAAVLVVSDGRYRFRHELVRQALVDELPPHRRLAIHRDTARRLADADVAPALVARHWLAGGCLDEAGDWLLAAARQAVNLGAFADAIAHLRPLLEHEPEHEEALRLRAEALDAVGDLAAPAAYEAAARVAGKPAADDLRAKQALAEIKLGDPAGALRTLEGVEPASLDGRLAEALALSGAAAIGFGDPQVGTAKAAEARRLALHARDPDAAAVASWAHAAAAHARGELRSSVLADLRETHSLPKLAVSVFDGQLCITQRLLYGARPYPDVIAFADAFAAEAERLGAARGQAFAVTIRGEAKLLAGQLDEADADLVAGAELHRRIAAATGEAFALQRRAEVALHRGLRAEAATLLDAALAIARESDVGFHLFDRIYGTRITAAADAASALAALEEAEDAVRGPVETCPGCRITLAVPAAIAAARAGDHERLARWNETAEFLATVVMRLPAWYAALDEVKGHRARLSADAVARDHFRTAAAGFAAAGQPLDQARCNSLAADLE